MGVRRPQTGGQGLAWGEDGKSSRIGFRKFPFAGFPQPGPDGTASADGLKTAATSAKRHSNGTGTVPLSS